MTDGIELHQPTESEYLPRHEKVTPPRRHLSRTQDELDSPGHNENPMTKKAPMMLVLTAQRNGVLTPD